MKKILSSLTILILLASFAEAGYLIRRGSFGVSSWQDRQKKCEITVPSSVADSDLKGFRVPIGKDASGTFVCSDIFSNSDSDGGDILVYDNCNAADCSTKNGYQNAGTNPATINTDRLAIDIEKWDTGGSLGVIWVEADVTNGIDSGNGYSIVVYYDGDNCASCDQPAVDAAYGQEATWAGGDVTYQAVYHFGESSGTIVNQANEGVHDLSVTGTPTYSQTGKLGNVVSLDNTGASETDYYSSSTTPVTDTPTTVTMWVYMDVLPSTYGDNYALFQLKDADDDNSHWRALAVDSGSDIFYTRQFSVAGQNAMTANTLSATTWYHAVARYIADNNMWCRVDNDLANDDQDTNSINPDAHTRFFSGVVRLAGLDDYFDGRIDELRITSVAGGMSDAWIKADYLLTNDPNSNVQDQTPTGI
jgi:hypothetical protein